MITKLIVYDQVYFAFKNIDHTQFTATQTTDFQPYRWIAAAGNFGLLDRVSAYFADLGRIVGAGLAILVIVANC